MTIPQSFNCQYQGNASWFDRADKAIDLLLEVFGSLPSPFSLGDVGCGDGKLKVCLERRAVNVRYAAYDLYPQSADVVKLDITREPLPENYHVVALLGVTEYLEDICGVLQRLSEQTIYLIVSHTVREHSNYRAEEVARLGWTNHLSSGAFEAMIRTGGFAVERRVQTSNKRTVLWRGRKIGS